LLPHQEGCKGLAPEEANNQTYFHSSHPKTKKTRNGYPGPNKADKHALLFQWDTMKYELLCRVANLAMKTMSFRRFHRNSQRLFPFPDHCLPKTISNALCHSTHQQLAQRRFSRNP